MAADIFALAFFVFWTALLWASLRRVDAWLRRRTSFRAAALLLETRRNG